MMEKIKNYFPIVFCFRNWVWLGKNKVGNKDMNVNGAI